MNNSSNKQTQDHPPQLSLPKFTEGHLDRVSNMPSNEEIDPNVLIDDEDLEEEDDDDEDEDLESYDEEDEDDDNHQPHNNQPLKVEDEDHFPFTPLPITTPTTTTPTITLQPTTTTITTVVTTPATPITALTFHPSPSSSLLALPIPPIIHEEEKKPSAIDDSRRLFQRLWTDEDEIGLLQGFLEYTSQRGGFKNSAYHHDTAPFYDQIKSRLQLDFNKSQLVEKLRRLKKKYRNVMARMNSGKDYGFKTPHDAATFEISKKIWCGIGGVAENALMDDDEQGNPNSNPSPIPHPNFNSHPHPHPHPNPNPLRFHNDAEINGNHLEKKPPASSSRLKKRSRGEENVSVLGSPSLSSCAANSSIPNVIEDTVRSCLSPLFKEIMSSAAVNGVGNLRGLRSICLNPLQLNSGGSSSMNLFGGEKEREAMDEKWRKQQILELEVYSKRVELVQDQIKLALEELRSKDNQ